MNNFPTRIKGLSDQRRLIPKGKIRLGIKLKNAKGVEYPKETEYFACHEVPEIEKIFGQKPKKLEIMFPTDKVDIIFPQAYECYGNSGLKCIGDGEIARRFDENRDYTEVECPGADDCEFGRKNGCTVKGHLKFFVTKAGIDLYQIDVGSINSIIDINSGLEWARLITGNFAMKPFILKRVPRKATGKGRGKVHYTLQLELVSNGIKRLGLDRPENKDEEAEEELKPEEKLSDNSNSLVEKIYQTALKKGLNNWQEIQVFAYRTSIISADQSMNVEQFKEELEKNKQTAELLLSKIMLITKGPGKG